MDEKFSKTELQDIFLAGVKVKHFIDSIAAGKGQDWMDRYLSGTTFVHGNLFGNNWTTGNKIHLVPGGFDTRTVVHELAHVYDNHFSISGFNNSWVDQNAVLGGGYADAMYY